MNVNSLSMNGVEVFADENAGSATPLPLSPGWTPVKPKSSVKRRNTLSAANDDPFALNDSSNLNYSAARFQQKKKEQRQRKDEAHENRFDLLRERLSASELYVYSLDGSDDEEDVADSTVDCIGDLSNITLSSITVSELGGPDDGFFSGSDEDDVEELADAVKKSFDRDASVLDTLTSGNLERNLSTFIADEFDEEDEADHSDASQEAISGDNEADESDDDDDDGVDQAPVDMSPAVTNGSGYNVGEGVVFSPRARNARRSLGSMSFTQMLPQAVMPLAANSEEQAAKVQGSDDVEPPKSLHVDTGNEDATNGGNTDDEFVIEEHDDCVSPMPPEAAVACVASSPIAVDVVDPDMHRESVCAGEGDYHISEGLPYATEKAVASSNVRAADDDGENNSGKTVSTFARMRDMITGFMTPKKKSNGTSKISAVDGEGNAAVAAIPIETPKTGNYSKPRSAIITRAVSKHDIAKIACMSPFVCFKKSLNQVDSVASILSTEDSEPSSTSPDPMEDACSTTKSQ